MSVTKIHSQLLLLPYQLLPSKYKVMVSSSDTMYCLARTIQTVSVINEVSGL